MKCSLSERFNRTLKEKIYRYMIANVTRKFIDVVPSLVSGYNNTIHTATKMRPAEINMFNAPALAQIWQDDFLVKAVPPHLPIFRRETLNSKWAVLYACRKYQGLLEKVIKAITRKRFLSFRSDAERHEKG